MMATITKVICDVCGLDGESYSIERGGRRANVDLCAEHAEPLIRLLEERQVARKRTPRRGKLQESTYGGLMAGSIEEVEAARNKS